MCQCALSLHVYQLHTLHTEVFILYICTVFFSVRLSFWQSIVYTLTTLIEVQKEKS